MNGWTPAEIMTDPISEELEEELSHWEMVLDPNGIDVKLILIEK